MQIKEEYHCKHPYFINQGLCKAFFALIRLEGFTTNNCIKSALASSLTGYFSENSSGWSKHL